MGAIQFLRDKVLIIEEFSGPTHLYLTLVGKVLGYAKIIVSGAASETSKRRAKLKVGAIVDGIFFIKNRTYLNEFEVRNYLFLKARSRYEIKILHILLQFIGAFYTPYKGALFDSITEILEATFLHHRLSIQNGVFRVLQLLNISPSLKCSRCGYYKPSGRWNFSHFICKECLKKQRQFPGKERNLGVLIDFTGLTGLYNTLIGIYDKILR